MALISMLRPLLGRSPRRSLAAWRLALAALAGLPAYLIASGVLSGGLAKAPSLVDAAGAYSMGQIGALFEALGPGFKATLAGALLAWIGLQLLTGVAVWRLRGLRDEPRVGRLLFGPAMTLLWPYLRVALISLLFLGLGLFALAKGFGAWSRARTLAGADAYATFFELAHLRAALTFAWLTLVGVGAFWARIAVAHDERRQVRRLVWPVAKLLWSKPWAALGFHALLSASAVGLGLFASASWRWTSPSIPLWLVVMGAQAAFWLWRVDRASALWASETCAPLRATPDEGWRIWSRAWARVTRPLRAPAASAEPAEASAETPAEAPPPPASEISSEPKAAPTPAPSGGDNA